MFGCATALKFAARWPLIARISISIPKKLTSCGLISLSQSSAARCSSRNFGASALDFSSKGRSGVVYKTSGKLAASTCSEFKGGTSISGQVTLGIEITSYLVFDIDPTVTSLALQFEQD